MGESDKFVVNHNINNLEDACEEPTLYREKKPVTIGFVGAVRYFEENVALIKSIQNSDSIIDKKGIRNFRHLLRRWACRQVYLPKNHEFLIDIFSALCKYTSDTMLLLIGDGPDCLAIEGKVREYGLSDQVKFLGQRSDISAL